jgi:HlyD family secretion protein
VTDAQTNLETAKAGPTQADLVAAQTRVTVAQATLAQASLSAPFAGTITDIQTIKGDIVSAGKTAFRIDNLTNMYVDLAVSEVDISNMKVGQAATLTFDAIPAKTYNGKVVKIGMVGTVSSGVVNYTVTVQMTDADEQVLSGMTAAVIITIDQHDFVLVVPNNAIKTSGGQRYVVVLYQGQQVQVPVEVGLVGDTTTEVTSTTLKEGDQVVVSGSTSSSTKTTTNSFGGDAGGPPGGGLFGP